MESRFPQGIRPYSYMITSQRPDLAVQAFQHLFTTQNLSEYTQVMKAISQIEGVPVVDSVLTNLIFHAANHLKIVITLSSPYQVRSPDWGDNLVSIICSLVDFYENTEPVFFCIAELLADEFNPWLNDSQLIAKVIEILHPLDNSIGRAKVLNALAHHVPHIDHLSPGAICSILRAFDDYENCREGSHAILSALALKILVADQFSAEEIDSALESLAYFNSSSETTAVLKALITHISLANLLNQETISTVFNYLSDLIGDEIDAALRALTPHISRIDDINFSCALFKGTLRYWGSSASAKYVIKPFAEQLSSHEQLDTGMIGALLISLKELQPTEGSTALMNALAQHICGAKQFDLIELSSAVSCLKHLTCNPEPVLEALTRQAQGIPSAFWEKESETSLRLFIQNGSPFANSFLVLNSIHGQQYGWSFCLVANSIFNLSWLLANESVAASSLVGTLLNKINEPFDIKKLHSINEQKMLMKHLLKARRTEEIIDLRGFPTNLAEFYLEAVLNELSNKKSTLVPLKLVYGKLGNSLHNKSLIRALTISYASPSESTYLNDLKSVIQKSIAKQVSSGERDATWADGCVMLTATKGH